MQKRQRSISEPDRRESQRIYLVSFNLDNMRVLAPGARIRMAIVCSGDGTSCRQYAVENCAHRLHFAHQAIATYSNHPSRSFPKGLGQRPITCGRGDALLPPPFESGTAAPKLRFRLRRKRAMPVILSAGGRRADARKARICPTQEHRRIWRVIRMNNKEYTS